MCYGANMVTPIQGVYPMESATKEPPRKVGGHHRNWPVRGFALRPEHYAWLARQSESRSGSRSEAMRALIDRAMEAERPPGVHAPEGRAAAPT